MCWVTKDKSYAVKKIAEQDISVFKVVKYEKERICKKVFLFIHHIIDKFVIKSIYHSYHYELNKTYRNDELILEQSGPNEAEFVAFVDEGFHSYSEECKYRIDPMDIRDLEDLIIMSPNNDYLNDDIICKNIKKMNCIIPKGSFYCENANGEIVSNVIIPVSIENF